MKKLAVILVLFFSLQMQARTYFAMDGGEPGKRKYAFTLSGSGLISFFQVDQRHSLPAVPRLGLGGNFRFSIFLTKSFHLQTGMEILSQSCVFETYYFAPGYSSLYDRSFGYSHRLRTYELYLPILFRVGLTPNESNAQKAFYLVGGWAMKLFLAASTDVHDVGTGKGIWGGTTELSFENWFINEQTGNVLIGGFGLDDRIGMKEKFVSYEINYRYNLSRFHYNGRTTTNTLLIKNSCVALQVGYRF